MHEYIIILILTRNPSPGMRGTLKCSSAGPACPPEDAACPLPWRWTLLGGLTRNSKPEARNPRPETRDPKPGTRDPTP